VTRAGLIGTAALQAGGGMRAPSWSRRCKSATFAPDPVHLAVRIWKTNVAVKTCSIPAAGTPRKPSYMQRLVARAATRSPSAIASCSCQVCVISPAPIAPPAPVSGNVATDHPWAHPAPGDARGAGARALLRRDQARRGRQDHRPRRAHSTGQGEGGRAGVPQAPSAPARTGDSRSVVRWHRFRGSLLAASPEGFPLRSLVGESPSDPPDRRRPGAVFRMGRHRSPSQIGQPSRPSALPINYVVDHGTVVFRTAEGTKLAGAVDATSLSRRTGTTPTRARPGASW
jgi:hypothetical protein